MGKMLGGDRLALARLISKVENRTTDVVSLMSKIHDRTGNALTVGLTGPPGAGKSTLADRLIRRFREKEKTVGVVAIDPSSPFSGGAVLGDRIRMQEHAGDEGVFIRSLGSRGSHGGLSRATREVIHLFDAFGFDLILVETVGVGQTELDIMEIVGTTVVILTPESGDTIQTMKAGILEIADIFVVNKADREGADQMLGSLKGMIEMGGKNSGWQIPVLSTQAEKDIGIDDLAHQIEAHQAFLQKRGANPRKEELLREEVVEIVLEEMKGKVQKWVGGQKVSDNPYLKAKEGLKKFLK